MISSAVLPSDHYWTISLLKSNFDDKIEIQIKIVAWNVCSKKKTSNFTLDYHILFNDLNISVIILWWNLFLYNSFINGCNIIILIMVIMEKLSIFYTSGLFSWVIQRSRRRLNIISNIIFVRLCNFIQLIY